MLGRLEGEHRLVASLLYGAGLRLMEDLRLLLVVHDPFPLVEQTKLLGPALNVLQVQALPL